MDESRAGLRLFLPSAKVNLGAVHTHSLGESVHSEQCKNLHTNMFGTGSDIEPGFLGPHAAT